MNLSCLMSVDRRISNDVDLEIARVEQLNAELAEGLRHCRQTLNRWRPLMSANNNEASLPDLASKGGERQEA